MRFSYAIIETKLGWVGILGSIDGLCQIVLPQISPQEVLCILGERLLGASYDISLYGDLANRLNRYFEGEAVAFTDHLDLKNATPFQFAVWQIVRSIPYGQTRSYGWVARQMEIPHGARAVGQALAKNPLPVVVPCHRIISSRGELGGFSYGMAMKRRLLQIEDAGL